MEANSIDTCVLQDSLGATAHVSLGRVETSPKPIDVPHAISVIDSLLQLRMYSKLRNYAGFLCDSDVLRVRSRDCRARVIQYH